MARHPAVYILASRRNGTLYIGVTSNLPARLEHHRSGHVAGFSQRYSTRMLAYFEMHSTMEAVITREKQLKEWRRAWKLRLIELSNPNLQDLWHDLGRF